MFLTLLCIRSGMLSAADGNIIASPTLEVQPFELPETPGYCPSVKAEAYLAKNV